MRRPPLVLCLSLLASPLAAQHPLQPGEEYYIREFPAHRIGEHLSYVGTEGLAAYLIDTPKGLILINTNLTATVPALAKSIRAVGFDPQDIRIILTSHSHFDHVEGTAAVKKLAPNAKYWIMDADVAVTEAGGTNDFQYAADTLFHFPRVKVDHVLHDGDVVELGGVKLTAHKTAGHTRGTTTWSMRTTVAGAMRDVLIIGSVNVNPGFKLVNNAEYPAIASDYEATFATLKTLPCDVFLGAHGSYYALPAKYARYTAGDSAAFVDSAGCRAYLANREDAFRKELAKQRGGN